MHFTAGLEDQTTNLPIEVQVRYLLSHGLPRQVWVKQTKGLQLVPSVEPALVGCSAELWTWGTKDEAQSGLQRGLNIQTTVIGIHRCSTMDAALVLLDQGTARSRTKRQHHRPCQCWLWNDDSSTPMLNQKSEHGERENMCHYLAPYQ